MTIRFFRNRERAWMVRRLPVRQTLIWAGPIFVLVKR